MIHKDEYLPVFEGVFTVKHKHHHIQTSSNYLRTRGQKSSSVVKRSKEHMVVWTDSDVWRSNDVNDERQDSESTCQFDLDLTLDVATEEKDKSEQLFRRQDSNPYGPGSDLISSIGSTEGCPQTRRIAMIGIATDCTYTRDFDSPAMARSNIIQQINSASQVYESTFNISLQIQNITISDANCPTTASSSEPWNIDCASDITLSNRLDLFSRWRGRISDTNAFWTLLSTCNTGSAVGLSWLGQVCRQGSSRSGGNSGSASGANVVVRTPTEWLVIAHEIGHIFGAVHDCTLDTCRQQQCCPLSRTTCDANGQYIMNPSTGRGISQFSPCSVGNICSFMGDGNVDDSCLVENTNSTTTPSARCGNGVVETGEECDCGGTTLCGDNPCCNPTTCRLRSNSVCDFATDNCCTQECQFITNSTECQDGRTCQNGDCDDQPDGPRANDPGWFDQNRTWVIAVAASVGGLIVLAILICCVWRYRKRKTVSITTFPLPGSRPGMGVVNQGVPPTVFRAGTLRVTPPLYMATRQPLTRYA